MKKLFKFFILLFFTVGFRTYYSKNLWTTSNSSELNSKLFIVYDGPTSVVSNDLNSSNDDLAGLGASITLEQVMDSVMEDYNSITGSYLNLVDRNDVDYSLVNSMNKKINISFAGSGGATVGHAQMIYENEKVVGCEISLESDLLDSAKDLVATLTHEIGHCLGLDHSQESVKSIMSYYSDSDSIYRLQIDDRMGITYLFASDQSKVSEVNTYGLSCDVKR